MQMAFAKIFVNVFLDLSTLDYFCTNFFPKDF